MTHSKDSKRKINVFLSSSLKLAAERHAIATAFKEASTEDEEFEVYIHEDNGVLHIIPGADSQRMIDAIATNCDVFVVYAGDYIGKATIQELENVMADSQSLFKYIYILHQPGLEYSMMLPEEEKANWCEKSVIPDNYVRWADYAVELEGNRRIKHYAKQLDAYTKKACELDREEGGDKYRHAEGIDNLKSITRRIANEILGKVLVEMSPGMVDYTGVISNQQKQYRVATDFYYTRPIDTELFQQISSRQFWTAVTGTSLTGKTRSVVEALKKLEPATHIHILRYDARAVQTLQELNVELQFKKEFRNVLFIDEIDSIIGNNEELIHKFLDLLNVAHGNPDWIKIITTSLLSAAQIQKKLYDIANAENFIDNAKEIPLEPLSAADALAAHRMMRRRGYLTTNNMRKISGDTPIGALFVDMDKLRNIYKRKTQRDIYQIVELDNGSTIPVKVLKKDDFLQVFDALKTLALWKVRSLGDPKQLLDFCTKAYPAGTVLTPDTLELLLQHLSEFLTLTSVSRDEYTLTIDDIIFKQVFRFEISHDALTAAKRAVDYVFNHLYPEKFENLTKMVTRMNDDLTPEEMTCLIDYITGRLDAEVKAKNLTSIIELDTERVNHISGNGFISWGYTWLQQIGNRAIDNNDSTLADNLWENDKSDEILALKLRSDRKIKKSRETLTSLLNENRQLPERLSTTMSYPLMRELVKSFDGDTAIALLGELNVEGYTRLTCHNIEPERRPTVFREQLSKYYSFLFNLVLRRLDRISQVKSLLNLAETLNDKYDHALFEGSDYKHFHFFSVGYWLDFMKRLPQTSLSNLFDRLNNVEISPACSAVVASNKPIVLNGIIKRMKPDDKLKAWGKLGDLRDSFSLLALLQSINDFAIAKGVISNYLQDEQTQSSRILLIHLNELLRKCTSCSDIEEGERLFRKAHVIGADENLDAINDSYTQGILLSFDNWLYPYDKKLAVLKKYRPEADTDVRPQQTIGVIFKYCPDFSHQWQLISDNKGNEYFTAAEIEDLTHSVYVLGWLIEKVNTPEDVKSIAGILRNIEQEERSGNYDELLLTDQTCTIISKLIKNFRLTPSYADGLRYVNELRQLNPGWKVEDFVYSSILNRFFYNASYNETDNPGLIDELNRRIIESTAKDKPEWTRTLVRYRFFLTSKETSRVDFNVKGYFPIWNGKGNVKVELKSRFDFAENMLKMGYIHAFVLEKLLRYMAQGNFTSADFNSKLLKANSHGIFIKKNALIDLKKRLRGKNIELDLTPSANGFSIVYDMTMGLHNCSITVKEAERKLMEYELTTGLKVERTQRYLDAVVCSLTKSDDMTLADIIDTITTKFPKSFRYNDKVIYFLLHKVRNLDDLNLIKSIYPLTSAVKNYAGLLGGLKACGKSDRPQIAVQAYADFKNVDKKFWPHSSYIMGILHYIPEITVDEMLDFARGNRLPLPPNALGHIFYKVNNIEEYLRVENLCQDCRPEPDHIKVLLYRSTSPGLFKQFQDAGRDEKWSKVITPAVKEILIKKLAKLNHRSNEADAEISLPEGFADFWMRVIGENEKPDGPENHNSSPVSETGCAAGEDFSKRMAEVTNREEFNALRETVDMAKAVTGYYVLADILPTMRNTDRVHIAKTVIDDLKRVDKKYWPPIQKIMSILRFNREISVKDCFGFFDDNKKKIDARIAGYLFNKVLTVDDYRLILERFGLSAPRPPHMLMLFFAMYNTDAQTVYTKVFDRFNLPEIIQTWKAVLSADPKIRKMLGHRIKDYYFSNTNVEWPTEFINFWVDICGIDLSEATPAEIKERIKKVRTADQFKSLKQICKINTAVGFYGDLLNGLKYIHGKDRREIALEAYNDMRRVRAEFLPDSKTVLGIMNIVPDLSLGDCMSLLDKKGLQLDKLFAAGCLFGKISNYFEYKTVCRRFELKCPFAQHIRFIFYAMYDSENNTIRTDVFESFNSDTQKVWKGVLNNNNPKVKEHKDKLYQRIKSLRQSAEKAGKPWSEDFTAFWETVLQEKL